MNEEFAYFDRWVHLLEVVIVAGIALVIYVAKKKSGK